MYQRPRHSLAPVILRYSRKRALAERVNNGGAIASTINNSLLRALSTTCTCSATLQKQELARSRLRLSEWNPYYLHHHHRHLHLHGIINITSSSNLQPRMFHPFLQRAIRWKSNDSKQPLDETPAGSSSQKAVESSSPSASAPESSTIPSSSPSSSSSAAIASQIEQRFKQVVDDLNLGDQFAVIVIAVFTAIILSSPYVIRQMKQSPIQDYSTTSEDPIDDLTTAVRRAWYEEEEEEEGDESAAALSSSDEKESRKSAVEYMLKDILKSQGLQHAAQQFLISILESAEFQAALQRLVKKLWVDLVNDPETVAQVVRLLQIAIQNPAIKTAAQQLVVDLVQEPDVKQALVEMLQEIGREPDVLAATQTLLTEATHNTLNDPEILDHSMEFATDVVGDDLVQKTAGEALRNSVSHAFRPATTLLLTATGVGLLIFGVAAIGYARSSDQEAVLFETAARSLQTNATYGMVRLLTWPVRVLQGFVGDVATVFWMPVEMLQNSAVHVGKQIMHALEAFITYLLKLPGRGAHAAQRGVVSMSRMAADMTMASLKDAGMFVASAIHSLASAFVSSLFRFCRHSATQVRLATDSFIRNTITVLSETSNATRKKGARALDAADEKIIDMYDKLFAMMEQLWKRIRNAGSNNTYFK